MTRQFGCLIFIVNVILTLGFGLALLLGLHPPEWGLFALTFLDIITFVGIRASQPRQ